MTVQPDLCPTCSGTTLLVFPRGGSNGCELETQLSKTHLLPIILLSSQEAVALSKMTENWMSGMLNNNKNNKSVLI